MRIKGLLVALLFLFMAGCSAASKPEVSMQVNVNEFAYDPSVIKIFAGQAVALTINNTGTVEHDFVIEHLDASDVEGNMESSDSHMMNDMGQMNYDLHISVLPGKSAVLKFTPSKTGTYQFFCTVAGHKEAGMVGTLVVEDSQQ